MAKSKIDESKIDEPTRILGYSSRAFANLLPKILNGENVPPWQPGKLLEYFILRAFRDEGAEITWPYEVRQDGQTLEQIDGAIHFARIHCLIEAKDHGAPLNFDPIAKLRNQLLRRPSLTIGSVFSRSGYTDPAKALARFAFPQTILLWEASELAFAFKKRRLLASLETKLRFAIEQAVPDYNVLADVEV